ncbi:MAG TPA: immunoglobulin domain-containing protein [Opitutaceae bacterium]|nr:immunoglobulin domain-containing protein [Opitutaceae bacterium]
MSKSAFAQVPVVSSVLIYGVAGVPITPVQVPATGSPTSFSSSLDSYGLSISSSGLITGTPTPPTSAGLVNVTVRAANGSGTSASADIALLISPAGSPTITSITNPLDDGFGNWMVQGTSAPYACVHVVAISGPVSAEFLPVFYTLGSTANNPAPGDWLDFVRGAAYPGVYTFAAEFLYPGSGTVVPGSRGAPFTVTVVGNSRPSVYPVTVNGQVGVPITPVQVRATNSPTSYAFSADAFGYRAGLSISSSGLITGTPQVECPGIELAVTASNAAGPSVAAPLTLYITSAATPPPPSPPPGGGALKPFYTIIVPSIPSANTLGSVIPGSGTLYVGSAGSIATAIADFGQPATLVASVSNNRPSQWQWSKDGISIPGATDARFTITSADPSTNGQYSCTATNADGTDTAAIQVTVGYPPTIVSQSSVLAAKLGDPVHLSVRASCPTGPMLFQWMHNGVAIAGATSGSQLTTTGAVDATSTYDVASASVADAGDYWCNVTCYGGTAASTKAHNTLSALQFIAQPQAMSVQDGQPVHLQVEAKALSSVMWFQWYHDGALIPGATNGSSVSSNGTINLNNGTIVTDLTSTFDIPAAHQADAGSYTCRVTVASGTYTTDPVSVSVTATAHLVNLSTRVPAGGAAGTPLCGFVTGGTQPLPVLIRAVGPTLASFGVSGVMAQPMIRLHNPDGTVTPYSGWPANRSADMTAAGAFALPMGSLDAATFLTLQQGLYTAEISDVNGGSGDVMLEIYDNSGAHPGDARLINASTRGFVGNGDSAMFTGFVVSGAGTVKVLIRAVGPGLVKFGVGDAITDPQIAVFSGQTQIAGNDNWGTRSDGNTAATIQSVSNSVGAFAIDAGSKDAVVLRDFSEGAYTAEITGVGRMTGTAIVELYVVP